MFYSWGLSFYTKKKGLVYVITDQDTRKVYQKCYIKVIKLREFKTITIWNECILIRVLNISLYSSFWKICPKIGGYIHQFSLKMQIHRSDFNVTNIFGTRTINVISTIPLKIFSALQAKRIIFITHYHGLYQSLPHHGTFNVDALTT